MTNAAQQEERVKAYQVTRHSGRSGTEFRVVLDTDDFKKAHDKYESISIYLRQGAVRFVQHGVIACDTSAPRLRTRW